MGRPECPSGGVSQAFERHNYKDFRIILLLLEAIDTLQQDKFEGNYQQGLLGST